MLNHSATLNTQQCWHQFAKSGDPKIYLEYKTAQAAEVLGNDPAVFNEIS